MNVIKQILFKVNQNISILILVNTKKSILVKEYEIVKLDVNELERIVAGACINCKNEYFHTGEYKCVYDIKFTNTNITKTNLSNTFGEREYKDQFYGLNLKN